jgi:ribosomal protein S16
MQDLMKHLIKICLEKVGCENQPNYDVRFDDARFWG